MENANLENDTQSQTEAAPKIKAMRRQPCPCGSGKVFKNCHEGDPAYEVATDVREAVAAPATAAGPGAKQPVSRSFPKQAERFSSTVRNTGTSHRRKV